MATLIKEVINGGDIIQGCEDELSVVAHSHAARGNPGVSLEEEPTG